MDKYYKYKNLFSGINTKNDIDFFISRCKSEDLNIIHSIVRSQNYQDIPGITDVYDILDKLKGCKYRQDIENILQDYPKYKNDSFQSTIFKDIMDSYPVYVQPIYKNLTYTAKVCPHCGKNTIAPSDTGYIVCGFDPQGIDMPNETDCSNDWCFKCGKKLCRNWFTDNLFNDINRIHNDICCKNHANTNKFKYPEEYCMCEQNRRTNATKLIL